MSLARRHRARMLGKQSAERAEKDGSRPNGRAASEYDLMRARLGVDLKRLKEIQSIEAKIELKRELLPAYADWVDGVLDAANCENATASQDDIVAQTMIWRFDVGDFEGAMTLARHVLDFELDLPERFNRTAGCLIAEEIAEAALATDAAGEAFDLPILIEAEELTRDEDMPDEARAKLFKAIGRHMAKQSEEMEADQDGPAGGRRAAVSYALVALRRALALNKKAGVKKDIERLEREEKKLAEAAQENADTKSA